MANERPSTPTDVRINGVPESPNMATKAVGSVTIKARISDPNQGQQVRVLAQINSGGGDGFTPQTDPKSGALYVGTWVHQGNLSEVTLGGLRQNTLYKVDLYGQDELGRQSNSYNRVSFWMNRRPNAPSLVSPPENIQTQTNLPLLFDWKHEDPDGEDQQAFRLRWRIAATATKPAGAWIVYEQSTPLGTSTYTVPAGTFKSNRFYEWQVRTQDPQDAWSDWSLVRSFYVVGLSSPPRPTFPIKGVAAEVDDTITFQWDFRDPDSGDRQVKADLQYRAAGTDPWFTLFGDTTTPGNVEEFPVAAGTFTPGYQYEWQVRTYDQGSGGTTPSDWSDSGFFWGINTPGGAVTTPVLPENAEIQGALGCGHYRVFVYDQGGQVVRGEITPITRLLWHRRRDDIGNALLTTAGFGLDCGELLANLRSWIHEIVVFRDNERVFEGPITRITYDDGNNAVSVEAKDVMAYVYRRIMRQGYNDSYRLVKGRQLGLTTIVNRAARIITNALAYHDPNVLPYLTIIRDARDARQSRVIPDYAKTAWEEVDDLASNAGLDYTTVGRRIILWDTHFPLGKLPEMRSENFSNPPIVTEYGMLMANYFAVTNGNGVWGAAYPSDELLIANGATRQDVINFQEVTVPDPFHFYGPVEQLASSYGEVAAGSTDTLTNKGIQKMVEAMEEQATRNIGNRWPTPLIVRVPDNSAIHPDTEVGINQLVPGVWIPLRSTGLRPVAQWQKLDLLAVEETEAGESVRVTMSPAPNGGNDDPDLDNIATEEGV